MRYEAVLLEVDFWLIFVNFYWVDVNSLFRDSRILKLVYHEGVLRAYLKEYLALSFSAFDLLRDLLNQAKAELSSSTTRGILEREYEDNHSALAIIKSEGAACIDWHFGGLNSHSKESGFSRWF